MNTRKGYTIIEVIVVLAIMSILAALFSDFFKDYSRYNNRTSSDYCGNSVMSFINTCKQYCYSKKDSGYIRFDFANSRMDFYAGGQRRSTWRFPKGFSLYSAVTGSGGSNLNFDFDGFTANACTIVYKDSTNAIHHITISVGTAYVEVKD